MPVQPGEIRVAVRRAGPWLAAFEPGELRFDAAIVLRAVRRRVRSDELDKAFERALAVARRDDDNPLLPLAGVDYNAPKKATSSWTAPAAGVKRINPNRVLAEAVHCRRHGVREATLAYVAGPMRDDGGYHTTHAAWAVALMGERGCLSDARYRELAASLRDQLTTAIDAAPAPTKTLDIDLMAERVLMLLLLGETPEALAGPLRALLELQAPDGSWGFASSGHGAEGDGGEPAYYRYHATMIAAWALTAALPEN